MRTPFMCAILGFAALAHSVAVPTTHVLHEKRDFTAPRWVKRDSLSPRAILPMRIGLKQRNLDRGHDFLMEVSHPDSKSYSQHWTAEEVNEMFAPDGETVNKVLEWLTDFGINSDRITHTDNKGWLAFDATTDEAERLLHTKYNLYEHSSTGHVTPACDSYHVPLHIREHIDYITPGIKLLAPMKRGHERRQIQKRTSGPNVAVKQTHNEEALAHSPNSLAYCDTSITPACIRALYGIPKKPEYPNRIPREDNSLGIFEQDDFYAQEDSDLFFANYSPQIPEGTQPIPAFIDGATAPVTDLPQAGLESDLDLQLAYPLIYPQTITLYQTDDEFWSNKSSGFNTFLDAIDGSYCTYSAFGETGDNPDFDAVYPDTYDSDGYQGPLQCGIYKPTNVISISYGGQEANVPASYQQRQCNEFMKLGLQGISIFYASGDDGVGGPPGDENDNGCLGDDGKIFSPAWPNSCPYVTNVGATKVYPGQTVTDPESAANDPVDDFHSKAFSSGGGFSNIYPQPDYQKAAVASYFENHDPGYKYYIGNYSFGEDGGIYNRIGRGYPDVAANGDNIATFHSGNYTSSYGTSASTPIFASLINRINEQRLNAGKTTVGFINPALYAHPEILNDIKNGSNPNCDSNGFSAVEGWDPVTGLGTPNYPKMVKFFLSLP